MRIKRSNSSNPGDLSLRIDSEDERQKWGQVFPGLTMKNHQYLFDDTPYPVSTSLHYDVIRHDSDSTKNDAVWTGFVGWDQYPQAVDVWTKAVWINTGERRGWDIKIRLYRGDTVKDGDTPFWTFSTRLFQARNKIRKQRLPVNVRQAICQALRDLFSNLDIVFVS